MFMFTRYFLSGPRISRGFFTRLVASVLGLLRLRGLRVHFYFGRLTSNSGVSIFGGGSHADLSGSDLIGRFFN